MREQRFQLVADVSSDEPERLRPVVESLFGRENVHRSADGFHVDCALPGVSARDLNRQVLSAMRKMVKRTRLRAVWTAGGVAERCNEPPVVNSPSNAMKAIAWAARMRGSSLTANALENLKAIAGFHSKVKAGISS